MRKMLIKEMKLSASCLSYFFILFGLMFFVPGYPILCGAFFMTLGIFQSFQNVRETNDILFSALLPIAKKDVVKAKYIFVCFIELCGLLLMAVATVIRMTVMSEVSVYRNNAMMNANLFALGMAFVFFGLFNLIFVGGFFKTAYKVGGCFLTHTIVGFVVIGLCEAIHHIPGFSILNSFGTDNFSLQLLLLIAGIIVWIVLTLVSLNLSVKNFEKIDL